MSDIFKLMQAAALAGGGGSSPAVLIDKTITENGEYDPADDDADGYSGVTVNVQGSSDQLYTGGLETGGINRSTGALEDDVNAVRTKDFIELDPGAYVLLWYYTNPAEMLYTWVEIYDESGNFVRSFDTYGATQPPFTFTLGEKAKVKFLWKRAYSAGYQVDTSLIPNIYLGLVPA